ncbi:MAG: GntR family transcriptional regulator [Enterocloster sp.]
MGLNKQTLSEQIYQILKHDILYQNIPSGSKLTLKMLQERFGVSSTPIREALTRLISDQLISYYSNVGVSVVSLDPRDIREIYQLMGDLDSLAVKYAADFPKRDLILRELEENIQNMELCGFDSPKWTEYSDQFHLIFYQYCCNSRLVRTAAQMRCQLSIVAYQYEQYRQNQELILKEHREIFDACRRDVFSDAVRLMKEHLMHSLRYSMTSETDTEHDSGI